MENKINFFNVLINFEITAILSIFTLFILNSKSNRNCSQRDPCKTRLRTHKFQLNIGIQ